MIERLEVTAGPGTVVRYGGVVAWAGATASSSLVSFLSASARNLAPSPVGGDQLADHLEGVLGRGDPEPDVPFIVIGPGEEGWTALLHGSVQVWDGSGWTAADSERGWRRARLWPRPTLSVSVSGTAVPPPSPDSMFDLEGGVVPGGGFVLVPAVAAASGSPASLALAGSVPEEAEATIVLSAPDPGPPTAILPVEESRPSGREEEQAEQTGAEPGGADNTGWAEADHPERSEADNPERSEADQAEGGGPSELVPGNEVPELVAGSDQGWVQPDGAEVVAESDAPAAWTADESAGQAAGEGPRAPGPVDVVDLKSARARSRVVPYPPLPPAGDPPRPVAGAPVVAGVPCPRGHLNRPGMASCARCGRPIADGRDNQVSGTRPGLGCLVTDEGAVYRLDSGYLVGADPNRDPTVRGRLARPLELPGDDVSASHAEVRLHDWDVVVTDRASEGGTHVFEPGAAAWERIRPYQPRVLPPGTHLAFGQRVVTFLTPWNTADGS